MSGTIHLHGCESIKVDREIKTETFDEYSGRMRPAYVVLDIKIVSEGQDFLFTLYSHDLEFGASLVQPVALPEMETSL